MYAPEFKFMPPPTYTEVSVGPAQDGLGGSGINSLDPSSSPSCPVAQVDPCVVTNNNNNNNVQ